MIFRSAIALSVPSLVIYAALIRPWGPSTSRVSRPLAAALSPGLAVGLTSCIHFFLLIATSSHRTALILDTVLWTLMLAVAGVDAWQRRGTRSTQQERETPPTPTRRPSGSERIAVWASGLGLLTLGGLATFAFWSHWAVGVHGDWDAWAIWNLRARAIWRGIPNWNAIVSNDIDWSHPDYPLLVPVTIARLWAFGKSESTVAPAIVAELFTVTSVATLTVSIGELRGWAIGLLSGAALLASRTFVSSTSCQCADVPLGFFILAALSLAIISWQEAGRRPAVIAAAGAASALAAWTKNEGQVLLALVVLFIGVSCYRWLRHAWRPFSVGVAVPLAALVWFKLRLAPPNYLFTSSAIAGLSARLTDHARWSIVWSRLTEMVPQWGDMRIGALAVLALAVVLTARPDRRALARTGVAFLLLGAVMGSYALVYVITPLPLDWQITTSFPRLMAQLWPALVWAGFQMSGTPRGDAVA
jgi:hypothetical protein